MKLSILTTLFALMSVITPAAPAADAKPTHTETAVVGGGCFWCVEGAYKIVPGILKITSGFAGGNTENPTYKEVCGGDTNHAEVVKVEFDPAKITYKDVIDLFWDLHDPTTLNRQGHDAGTQYRSIILYESDEQKKIAEASMAEAKSKFSDPIVTQIVPLKKFYPAEGYHQDYFANNPNQPYCQSVVGPKIAKFKKKLEERNKAAK
ncbi:MAG: msrA [Verrucomicrobiaceae bacterium]|nr:msrA [Verrucomicrobiaceae bacterium]